jgi:phosphoserine phosphatase RsbU/P
MNAPLAGSERRFERLRLLTEVSRALTYTTSIEEVLRLAVKRTAELVGADKALLLLADADGLLVVRAAHGVDEERLKECRERLDEGLVRKLQNLLDYSFDESFLSVPLVAHGQVTGVLAAVRPAAEPATDDDEWLLSALADQTAVALENARLTEAVEQEREERGRAAEAQGRAHAILGHELRSPLNAIQAYSSLLLEGLFDPLTDRQRESVSRIRMSGQHLLSVVEGVLDMARIHAGTIALTIRDVPLAEVLAEAVQLVQHLAARKDQTLRTSPAPGLVLRADPHRVRQALVNLISNAIKYTPDGGEIEVDVATRESEGRRFAAIAVRDNGRGIPAAALATIFEPYDRGEADDSETGLGLGLSISREMVRQMGGEIEVVSEPGSGSTFTALLPLATEGDAA